MKLVHLWWVDSCSPTDSGWQSTIGRSPSSTILCESIEWIVYEDAEVITLAGHLSYGAHDGTVNQCHGEMTIPKVALVKRRKVT